MFQHSVYVDFNVSVICFDGVRKSLCEQFHVVNAPEYWAMGARCGVCP